MNSIFIAPEVDRNQISPAATLYPGCQIRGTKTSIGPGCELGAEGSLILENCQLARNVKLKGGFFSGAVFLDGAQMGSGAQIRSGTILEEKANGAHTIGLKQTILFPFVTLGSLINFCDILLAGGTSLENCSEVGSSYIHFNFTSNQDKATASLLGDVSRGVLLNRNPIFLGGQGGLVGPARINYGCVVAAGGICRNDLHDENQLHIPPAPPTEKTVPFQRGIYKKLDRVVQNNLIYLGNLRALKAWYQQIRRRFIRDAFDQAAYDGALKNLDLIWNERLFQLDILAEKVATSATPKPNFCTRWFTLKTALETPADIPIAPALGAIDYTNYLTAIQNLTPTTQLEITTWLEQIINKTPH
jgi:UDP-N-acetylglucosamine/UDP-N-acetylgalactosamine diphosphorylase